MARIKSVFRFSGKFFLPLVAITIFIDIWDVMNKLLIVLLVIYLVLSILEKLEKLGIIKIKFRPLQKLKGNKLGKIFIRLIRLSNPITQYTEEHMEETSELIANGIIQGTKTVKKIKEEIEVKKKYEALKLFLGSHKRLTIGYILAILYITDSLFHWATDLGIPNDWLPYIAIAIVAFIFYVMGIEGFTFNDVNQIRKDAKQAKRDALVSIGSTKKELKKVNTRIKELKNTFGEFIPVEYSDEWNILELKFEKLTQGLESLNEDLEKAIEVIRTGIKK